MRATRRPRSCNNAKSPAACARISVPNPNGRPGICELVAGVVDHLQVEARRRPALVQLAGRVQVARAEAVGDDAAGRLPRSLRERGQLGLGLRRRVDERLDADVVAVVRLREELLDRPLGLDWRVVAGGEDLRRLVLGRLHVGLVERD